MMTETIRKKRILFVCIHNSARSQMAEAWMNDLCRESFEAESAGLEPGTLNPLAVQVMTEAGIDISGNKTRAVSDVLNSNRRFDYVVTVCDESSAEQCPIVPGATTRLHWSFPDPSVITGTSEEKLEQVRKIRDAIKEKIEKWCAEMCEATNAPLV
jgi:arsenate reductase (thioredoxin)